MIIAAVLLAAGCTRVGPEFEKPEAEVTGQWEAFESKDIKPKAPGTAEWWRSFNDPVLDQLIATAYAENLSLEAAGLRVLEARAQTRYRGRHDVSAAANVRRRSHL